MHKFGKQSTTILVILMLLAVPCISPAADYGDMENRDPQVAVGKMIADAIVVRPLGIVSTVLGFGFFVISSPFSLLGGNAGAAWNTMVVWPAGFTFVRPLGQFD